MNIAVNNRFNRLLSLEVFISLMAVIAIGASAFYAKPDWTSVLFGNLEQVSIKGKYKRLDRLELEEIFGAEMGKHLLDVDILKIERRLKEFAWLKTVVIRRVWPDSISAEVTERQAVARWQDKGLVDRDGEVFFPDYYQQQNLPVFVTQRDRNASALSFYYRVTGWLDIFNSEVTYLIEDTSQSRKIIFDNGLALTLGKRNVEQRLQRLIKSYHAGFNQVIDKVQCIDLRYPDGFSVGWKNKQGGALC